MPSKETKPPLLREHRLYQADWLLRFYGFKGEELLDESRPYFNVMLDPNFQIVPLGKIQQFVELHVGEVIERFTHDIEQIVCCCGCGHCRIPSFRFFCTPNIPVSDYNCN